MRIVAIIFGILAAIVDLVLVIVSIAVGSIIVGLDRRLDHCRRWAVFQREQG